MARPTIYLDHCATTPPRPALVERMMAVAGEFWGNPSSPHHMGRRAAKVLAEARAALAEWMGARPSEIVFCSSGTEANNLAVAGVIADRASRNEPTRVGVAADAHPSVLQRIELDQRLWGDLVSVVQLPVDSNGQLIRAPLEQALAAGLDLVSLLHCNNETGAVQQDEIVALTKLRSPRTLLHVDWVQSAGRWPLDMRLHMADFLTVSSHKIYGPRGAALLFVRNGIDVLPSIAGGAQEKFRRSGTEDLAAIVGFAEAAGLLGTPEANRSSMARLEEAFLDALNATGASYAINGGNHFEGLRMPGVLNLHIPGAQNKEDLIIALDLEGLCVSSTSACHSGVISDSHVLQAMGASASVRAGSIRLAFAPYQDENVARIAGTTLGQVSLRFQTSPLKVGRA